MSYLGVDAIVYQVGAVVGQQVIGYHYIPVSISATLDVYAIIGVSRTHVPSQGVIVTNARTGSCEVYTISSVRCTTGVPSKNTVLGILAVDAVESVGVTDIPCDRTPHAPGQVYAIRSATPGVVVNAGVARHCGILSVVNGDAVIGVTRAVVARDGAVITLFNVDAIRVALTVVASHSGKFAFAGEVYTSTPGIAYTIIAIYSSVDATTVYLDAFYSSRADVVVVDDAPTGVCEYPDAISPRVIDEVPIYGAIVTAEEVNTVIVHVLNMVVIDLRIVVVVGEHDTVTHKIVDVVTIDLATLDAVYKVDAVLGDRASVVDDIAAHAAAICGGVR